MAPQLSSVYISAAFNRANHVADWANAPTSTLAFASNKSIGIWKNPGHPANSQVTHIIQSGFSKSISCLKFASLPISSSLACIVAGSSDGSLGVWTAQPVAEWKRLHLIKNAHQGSVSALGVLRNPSAASNSSIFVSGASDGLLKVWHMAEHSEVRLSQTIDLSGNFPLDVALIELPAVTPGLDPQLLMVVATTSQRIHLYASDAVPNTSGPPPFKHKVALDGHEDWVKSLDLCRTYTSPSDVVPDTLMLASGSQDGSVRLWKIASHSRTDEFNNNSAPALETTDEFERMVTKIESDRVNQDGEMSTRACPFSVIQPGGNTQDWAVTFDALLVGHDNWVTGVRWHPPISTVSGDLIQPAAILSSSADNSLILWTPSGQASSSNSSAYPAFDRSLLSSGGAKRSKGPISHHIASSIWMPSQRFGEVGGASNLGFFGALWNPVSPSSSSHSERSSFSAVMAHGWGGSAHIWTLSHVASTAGQPQWQDASPVTGHFGAAKCIAWEPCGQYLLSCSDDQTTRLHAQPSPAPSLGQGLPYKHWHEVARPQSHGYDLHSVSWLDRLNFVSAADEKVIRVFSAPRGFVGTVGSTGLACARLGSEDDSRKAVMPHPGHDTLVCLEVDEDVGLLSSAKRHGVLLSQAMDQHYNDEQEVLTAIVCSSLFAKETISKSSFKNLELYLKWLYAQAWQVAVKKGQMVADINILLVPKEKLESTSTQLYSPSARILIDDTIYESHKSLWAGLGAAATPISTNVGYDENSSVVGQDDGKGFVTYPVVALGGTFDHLHVGHKILLSMAALVAEEKIIVGVTDDAMLTKKSDAHLLEPIDQRIASVKAFIGLFRLAYTPLIQEVVKLEDVAGPAATEPNLQALIVTDETLSGADFIDGKRKENRLNSLENWIIGVVGSEGETDLTGDAKVLAASKIGSTAIRKWLAHRGPRSVHALETARRYRVATLLKRFVAGTVASDTSNMQSRPVGASVPPLGLSNRAVFEGSNVEEAPSATGQPVGPAKESMAAVLRRPPTEEQLGVETLWPELEKLYGHGYELLWVSANPKGRGMPSDIGGRFVASCCRATSESHAVVRIHDRERNWMECGVLSGHSLSITRIQWSLDSRYILSCSRDRSWRMYERTTDEEGRGDVAFVPFTGERSHARIIWDVSWSKDSATPYLFATASRDKTVKVFHLISGSEKPFELLQTIKFTEPATAVAFGVGQVLAVGKESGGLEIFQRVDRDDGPGGWSPVLTLHNLASDQINQLEFRPPMLEDGDDALLASASEDGTVRIVRITDL